MLLYVGTVPKRKLLRTAAAIITSQQTDDNLIHSTT